jgi:signal peptidase I
LNIESNTITKSRAKRSSSETLLKRSAPEAEWNGLWNDDTDIFPEMIEEILKQDHSIRFRAPGDSMYPTICDGDVITVMPIETASIIIGDIILYRHKSGVIAHRVMRIIKRSAPKDSQNRSSSETLQFILRGDAALVFDDPVSADHILGKVTLVEREGRHINPYSFKATICFKARRLATRLKRTILFQT